MNLEQRLAAVEAELAEMNAHRKASENIPELVRNVASQEIKKALIPGGVLHKQIKEAAHGRAAYDLKVGVKACQSHQD